MQRWACGPALRRRFGDGQQEIRQLLQTIALVAALRAKALAGDGKLASGRNATCVAIKESRADVVGKGSRFVHAPTQNCLCRELVDILATGPAGANVGESQLV